MEVKPSASLPGSKGLKSVRQENERLYGQPLPHITSNSWLSYILWALNPFAKPQEQDERVIGILDIPSRSVWVYDEEHQLILWRRGFFGKGNLSRSEPTWLKREISRLQVQKQGGKELTAEELTARRREIRKQFKQQRAEAVAAAAAEAEQSFAANPDSAPVITTVIPSTQTADLNKRLQETLVKDELGPLPDLTADEMPQNMEHLQLSLQEAFFLTWTVRCLTVYDSDSGEVLDLPSLWRLCLQMPSQPKMERRIDNPFLVNYVAYHHFRSLGWVVKSGIKFCVDYLLYKRGPVFHHAEFAVSIIPYYSDPEDRETSPYNLPNSKPMSWQWFATINRANSQVMKTLVLAHVIIPPNHSIPAKVWDTPEILSRYSVKEIVILRSWPVSQPLSETNAAPSKCYRDLFE